MDREKNGTYIKVAKTVLLVSILSMLPMNLGQVSAAASCNLKAKRVVCPNADLRKASFKGANLRSANLRGANLSQVLIKDARNWEGADLTGANLTNVNFAGTPNYPGANLSRVKFVGALIKGATFCYSDPATCAVLDLADFTEADATVEVEGKRMGQKIVTVVGGAIFQGAVLTNVSFNRADLTDVLFWNANLKTASFNGANISGANFASSLVSEMTLQGAIYGPGLGKIGSKGTLCPKGTFTLVGPCPL
jgi:uncharacterized protein YjbI with pentapeptide repeats